MNRFRNAAAVLALMATIGASSMTITEKVTTEQEGEWALNMVTRTDISITEEYMITELFENGDLRGEKTAGSGEGVYLTKEQLKAYGLKLGFDDVIRVSWVANDYWNESWDKIERIEVVKLGK